MKRRGLVFALSAALLTLASARVDAPGTDLADPGPFLPGFREVTVRRPNNSTFTAILFYPATARGSNAPFNPAGGPYPAITFGHGFLQAVSRYQSTLEHLASHGYLVIASTSEGGLFPNHQNFANDMGHCLTYLTNENSRSGSFLFGAVRTDRYGASGHSMGGGASILLTAQDSRIKALANLAAADTNPSAITAMGNVRVPVSLIAGTQDSITPVENHGLPMYERGRAPRQLPLLTGGWHCGFMDSNNFGCDSGQMSRSRQLAWTRRLLTAFFNLYLKSNRDHWRVTWGPESVEGVLSTSRMDPGMELLPQRQSISVPAGGTGTATLTLRNTASVTQTFTIGVEGGGNRVVLWGERPTLAPGQSRTLTVTVRRPASGGSDHVIVYAQTDRDHLTRQWARIGLTASSP